MNNPLYRWRKQMIDFEHYRDNKLLSTEKGLKSSNVPRKVINFFPEVDIQIGDIFINSGIKYYVTEVDTQTYKGETFAKKAYYTTSIPKPQTDSTVFNINNAPNSIIGNQQSAILNNSHFNIDDLKQLIALYGENDKQQLYELTFFLKDCLDKDDFHKSKLSKFGDLIAKHSWLPLAISQIIAGFLQSH